MILTDVGHHVKGRSSRSSFLFIIENVSRAFQDAGFAAAFTGGFHLEGY